MTKIFITRTFCEHDYATNDVSSPYVIGNEMWEFHEEKCSSPQVLFVVVGIAWDTTIIRISFPALNNIFSFHPDNLLSNLSLSCQKELHFDFPTKDGRPK